MGDHVRPRTPQSYFPQAGHIPVEPTEEEIYGRLTKEVQRGWTQTEWLSRGYSAGPGVREPGIRTVSTEGIREIG